MNSIQESAEARELTITALMDAGPALAEFRELFVSCSSAIERNDIESGLDLLEGTLPHLSEFARFAIAVFDECQAEMAPESRARFEKACFTFEDLLTQTVSEFGNENYVNAADLLRYDMCEILNEFSTLFAELAEHLQVQAAG